MSRISRIVNASLLVAGIFAGGAGCSVSRSTVLESFGGDFSCDKKQIHIDHPDSGQRNVFRAVGCNRRVTYRCSGDYGELCERVGEPQDIKPEAGLIDTPVRSDEKPGKASR